MCERRRSRQWNDPEGSMSSTGAAWVFGTGGIGSAILDRLSSERQVIGFDKAPVTSAHPTYQVDLRDRAALKQAAESAAQCYGWPEVLILTAGRVSGLRVEDSGEADACDLIFDNILPAINVLHAAYHLGQPRTRTCILVTSNAAVAARPGQPVYAAAKAAVASLARSLAASWSSADIRIIAVAPGTVIVDRNRHAVTSRYPDAPLDPGRPGGRLLQPPELAEFIACILPHAGHLTGQLLTLDGGSTLPGLK